MAIPITCPACGMQGRAPEAAAGRRVKCRQCGKAFGVPAVEEVPTLEPEDGGRGRRGLVALAVVLLVGAVGAVAVFWPRGEGLRAEVSTAAETTKADEPKPEQANPDQWPGEQPRRDQARGQDAVPNAPGEPALGAGVPGRQGNVPEGQGNAPDLPQVLGKRPPLGEDDWTLMKLASNWHYVNGQRMTGSVQGFLDERDVIIREASKPGEAGELGKLVFANLTFLVAADRLVQNRRKLMEDVPGELFRLGIVAAAYAIEGRKLPGLTEFRVDDETGQAIGKMPDEWFNALHANEVGKVYLQILTAQAGMNIARILESRYAPRMGREELPAGQFELTPRGVDRHSPAVGKFVEVKYTGEVPLFRVVIVGRLLTTGANATLSERQQAAAGVSDAAGADKEQVDRVRRHLQYDNYLRTMPKGGIVYIRELNPGDVVQIGLGNADAESITGGSVAVYCDQGQLAARAVEFPRAGRR